MTLRGAIRGFVAALRAVDDGAGPPAASAGLPYSTAQLRAIRASRPR